MATILTSTYERLFFYRLGEMRDRGFESQIYRASGLLPRSSYENVAVRVLCADTHPDHDTICAFRRNNGKLLAEGFAKVLVIRSITRLA